jgi:hypothetical protein
LLSQHAPEKLAWLEANHNVAWGVVGLAWVGSFAYNLLNTREKKARISVEGDGEAPSKPALA